MKTFLGITSGFLMGIIVGSVGFAGIAVVRDSVIESINNEAKRIKEEEGKA